MSNKIDTELFRIQKEYLEARRKFPPMHSSHEGWAVIREEVDELWEAVKDKDAVSDDLRKEATQIAAMALAFLLEVCE